MNLSPDYENLRTELRQSPGSLNKLQRIVTVHILCLSSGCRAP